MTLLAAAAFDTMLLLALGLVAAAVMRRRSASLRHAVLAVAILSALLMPVFELVLPALPVLRWPEVSTVTSSGLALVSGGAVRQVAPEPVAGVASTLTWTSALLIVWLAGVLITGAALVTGMRRLAALERRCTAVTGRWRELIDQLARECGVRRRVELLQSDDPSLLVTCGVRRPRIILPVDADGWADDRIRVVLRHELSHIRRHDAVVQLGAELLRVLHWMNPLVWIACRRLRQESEYACDDEVLVGGVEATDYATHLLDVAKHLSARHRAWASAPAVAHPSTLERRIAAMLHRHRDRAPLGPRGWAVASLVTLGISLPLAAAGVASPEPPGDETAPLDLSLPAEESTGSIAAPASDALRPRSVARPSGARTQTAGAIEGRVMDPTGGVLPGVEVTLKDASSGVPVIQHTNASGVFAFRNLPPGQYLVSGRLVGFTSFEMSLALRAGDTVRPDIKMAIGTLAETVTIRCSGADPFSLARRVSSSVAGMFSPVVSAQTPIRVGGNIKPPMKIKDVKPRCPADVPSGETALELKGRVNVDGDIEDLVVLPDAAGTPPPAQLADAARAAVEQWKFTPTLLNREPVDVDITVHIVFEGR